MHGQQLVWVFFASLLIPVVGLAFCWRAWLAHSYPDRRRRRIVQAGLVVGSVAVLFAAALPLAAMLPVHIQGSLGEALTGGAMVMGVSAPPLAAVRLAFGFGRERWLGIVCVLLALAADLAMILGTQG